MSKISTPVWDFVMQYKAQNTVRLHMPGHKGKNVLGLEGLDITEIGGADSLYEADGIIAQSEKNLSTIFGTKASFYSTEGSSLCIRAMLYTALKNGKEQGRTKIVAARNVHKTFVYAMAMLDFEAVWLLGEGSNLYSCKISPNDVEKALSQNPCAAAVYLTSPDYLGNVLDIKAISEVCRKYDVPLIVDNAHGAYLKFLPQSKHPMDLGADMCCDSAHKTLPTLTGGAYLHVSKNSKYGFEEHIKNALALFASTSPSYLILASLDKANEALCGSFAKDVQEMTLLVKTAKSALKTTDYAVCGDEELKITLQTKKKGYYGNEIAQILIANGVVPEAYDKDYAVLMVSPSNTADDIEKLVDVLLSIPTKQPINEAIPDIPAPVCSMPPRQAVMSMSEKLDVRQCEGRILALPSVSCPPAIPIAVCGEKLEKEHLAVFEYYGVKYIDVVKDRGF